MLEVVDMPMRVLRSACEHGCAGERASHRGRSDCADDVRSSYAFPDCSFIAPTFRTIIFAAHDTTSSALCRLMHTLCVHPDAQEKLRQEVIEARRKNNGADLSYDELVALPYLDAICRETLRLYVEPICIFVHVLM